MTHEIKYSTVDWSALARDHPHIAIVVIGAAEPHTPEWFTEMDSFDPEQAARTAALIARAGHADICTCCGAPGPHPIFEQDDYPQLRLCPSCRRGLAETKALLVALMNGRIDQRECRERLEHVTGRETIAPTLRLPAPSGVLGGQALSPPSRPSRQARRLAARKAHKQRRYDGRRA